MSAPVGGPPGPSGGDVLGALRDGRIQGESARLRAATRLLEGSFYEEMFKAMRSTLPTGGAIETSQGEEIFTGLMDQHVADAAAMQSERGLGEALYRYFARSLTGREEG
jgi:flagellar protein FlgJ